MPKGYDRGKSRFERGRDGGGRDEGRGQGYGYGGDREYDADAPAFGSPIFGGDPNAGGGRPVFRGSGRGDYRGESPAYGGERQEYGQGEDYDPDTPAFGGPAREYDGEGREYEGEGGEYDGEGRGYGGGGYDDDGSFEDDWDYGRGGGGGRRLSTIIFIAIAVVVIVTIVIITKNLFGSAPSQGKQTTSPPLTGSPTVTAKATATETLSSESPTATATETAPAETATEAPSATPQPTQTPGETETMTVPPIEGKADVSDYLSLRKSASASSEKLEEIPKDGTFKILEVSSADKKWLKVEYSGKTGYVNANWVAIGEGGTDKVCTVNTYMLKVRSGAGMTNPEIGVLKQGDTVLWLSETTVSDTVWCKIRVGDVTGYVSKKYCLVLTR